MSLLPLVLLLSSWAWAEPSAPEAPPVPPESPSPEAPSPPAPPPAPPAPTAEEAALDPASRFKLSGTVEDDSGLGFPNVKVTVLGLEVEAWTDADGRFGLSLPPGSWTLQIAHEWLPVEVPAVVVDGQPLPALTIVLQPVDPADVEEINIVAKEVVGGLAASLEEKRESRGVVEVLGQEQMVKSGDGTASVALQRVTGLTLLDGRYVYVRGLGDRYSSTLLNGATLPSTEPEKRVVPLDLFATSLLDSVVVYKTWSPELPADFGGGAVVLRTRGIPARSVAQVQVSAGAVTGTTFTQARSGAVGPTDFLGFGSSFRALPDEVIAATKNDSLDESDRFSDRGFSADELERLGEAFPNRWGDKAATVRPDLALQANIGDRFEAGEHRFGVFAGLTWDNRWRALEYTQRYAISGEDGALEVGSEYDFEELTNEIQLGGLVSLGWAYGKTQEIKSVTMLNRHSEAESRFYEGYNRDLAGDIRVRRLRWVERSVLVEQLSGRHEIAALHGLTPTWRYTLSLAGRAEPDQREARQDREGTSDQWFLSDRPEGNSLFDSRVDDRTHDGQVDLKLPVGPEGQESSIQLGGQLVFRDRTVDTRRFSYLQSGPLAQDPDVNGLPVEEVFTPEHIDPEGYQIEEVTRQTDNYVASQRIYAGYLIGNLDGKGVAPGIPALAQLRVMAGARVEASSQTVTTSELFNPDAVPVVAELGTIDVLPAVSLTEAFGREVALAEGLERFRPFQVRLGYGRTVSRPDFRELSPASFNDVTGGRETFGNPDLKRAVIDHLDARLEWYPSPDEALSFGVFAKRFDSPIENVVVVSAQQSRTWTNALSARNAGIELEARKTLRELGGFFEHLTVAGNGSLVLSEVKIDPDSGIQTSDERPLQGQSPWMTNVQLGWDNPWIKTSVMVSYNVQGPRIVEVGALGVPDVIELPQHRLDLTVQQGFAQHFQVRLRARNLLDAARVRTQGDVELERVREGASFLLSLAWNR